jgi:hypothetical protein
MTPTLATKAVIDDAVDYSSHPLANDSKALIGAGTVRVLDDKHFDGSAAVAATGDITVVPTTPGTKSTISIEYSGHHSSLINGVHVTIGSDALIEGNHWLKGASGAEAATNLTAAIDALTTVTAVKSGSGPYTIAIEAANAGAAGNLGCSTDFPAHITVPAGGVAGGADFVGPAIDSSIIVNHNGGSITLIAKLVENLGSFHFKTGGVDNTDSTFHTDIATSIKNVIANDANFTAEVTNNVVTASQAVAGAFVGAMTSSAGTITVDANFANGEDVVAQVTASAGEILIRAQGNAGNTRNKVKKAINGAQDDTDVVYGLNSTTTIEDGIDGYTATNGTTSNKIKLEAESAGATSITTLLSDLTTLQTATGTADTGAIGIPLSNLDQPNNPFTVTESAGGAGDFRKFLFHTLQKYVDYLSVLEGVATIGPAAGYAGTGYLVDEIITLSGGGGTGATAKVASVGGAGQILTCEVLTAGSAYTTSPSASIQSVSGTGCTLEITLTAESPNNMVITSTNLQTASDTTATKSYTVQFNFSISALDVSTE